MPRNGSSVYSLPVGNPVIPGTIISTTWANSTLTDIATALTNSLSTDGSTATVSLAGKTMSGGTLSSPTVSGLLDLTSGQMRFPAVAVPSANANTLDDYEEGTWTPSITFATPGNLAQPGVNASGFYVKIGRTCHVDALINAATFTWTTSAGFMQVLGQPFPSDNTSGYYTSFATGRCDGFSNVGFTQIVVNINSGVSNSLMTAQIVNVPNGANGLVTTANTPSGSGKVLQFSGTYITVS